LTVVVVEVVVVEVVVVTVVVVVVVVILDTLQVIEGIGIIVEKKLSSHLQHHFFNGCCSHSFSKFL